MEAASRYEWRDVLGSDLTDSEKMIAPVCDPFAGSALDLPRRVN